MKVKHLAPDLEDTSDRWEAQLRKGAVEMAALAILCEKPLYGLEIIRVLEDRSKLVLAEGTVYPILNRLKAEGFVTSEWIEADAGHPRKYYALTRSGRIRLDQMANTWKDFASGINRLLKPALDNKQEAYR